MKISFFLWQFSYGKLQAATVLKRRAQKGRMHCSLWWTWEHRLYFSSDALLLDSHGAVLQRLSVGTLIPFLDLTSWEDMLTSFYVGVYTFLFLCKLGMVNLENMQ